MLSGLLAALVAFYMLAIPATCPAFAANDQFVVKLTTANVRRDEAELRKLIAEYESPQFEQPPAFNARIQLLLAAADAYSTLGDKIKPKELYGKALSALAGMPYEEVVDLKESVLAAYALYLEQQGEYQGSVDIAMRAKRIAVNRGMKPFVIGNLQSNLGRCYSKLKDWPNCFLSFEEAVRQHEREKNVMMIEFHLWALDSYALSCMEFNRLVYARELLQKALDLIEKYSLYKNMMYPLLISHMVECCEKLGDFELSRKFREEAAKNLPLDSPFRMQMSESDAFYFAQTYASSNPRFAQTILDLNNFVRTKRFGALDRRMKYQEQAGYAIFSTLKGDFKSAVPLYVEAAKLLGDVSEFDQLAFNQWRSFNSLLLNPASESYRQYLRNMALRIESSWSLMPLASEAELTKQSHQSSLMSIESLFSVLPRLPESESTKVYEELFQIASWRKCLIQQRMIDFYAAMRASSEKSDVRRYRNELTRLSEWQTLDWNQVDSKPPKAIDSIARDELKLNALFMPLTVKTLPAKVESRKVMDALAGGRVLVDFYEVNEPIISVGREIMTPGLVKGPVRKYYAFVVSNSVAPKLYALGEAEKIDKLVKKFHELIREQADNPNSSAIKSQIDSELAELFNRLALPIWQDIKESRELLISTDGLLSLLPFESLRDEAGRYLIEKLEISYIDSARDLFNKALKDSLKDKPTMLMVANPEFNLVPVKWRTNLKNGAKVSIVPRVDASWSALPKTQKLYKTVNQEFRKAYGSQNNIQLLSGNGALEESVKTAPAPTYLHISTHGYFSKPNQLTPQYANKLTNEQLAMMRTGIVLCGGDFCNLEPIMMKEQFEDGYLTAQELALMNLEKTKLAFICACDTGSGVPSSKEGVYGLRRALRLAGVQTSILSLFPIPEEASTRLANQFYIDYFKTNDPAAALREAKLSMIKAGASPLEWAGLIVDRNVVD